MGEVEPGDFVVGYFDSEHDYMKQGVCMEVGDRGTDVRWADGDQGLAFENKVWKLNLI